MSGRRKPPRHLPSNTASLRAQLGSQAKVPEKPPAQQRGLAVPLSCQLSHKKALHLMEGARLDASRDLCLRLVVIIQAFALPWPSTCRPQALFTPL